MYEIESITVEGFKSIKKIADLPLRSINVLIGANGSGKSNFLAAFELIRATRGSVLNDYVIREGGANRVLHFGSKRTREIKIALNMREPVKQYRLNLLASGTDELRVRDQELKVGEEAIEVDPNWNPDPSDQHLVFDGWRVYSFQDAGFTSPLKLTAYVDDNRALRNDGRNLSAFLYFLKERHPSSYRIISRTIRQAAPFFREFRLQPQSLAPQFIRLEWLHEGTDEFFDVSAFSTGTLRFIALATLFLQPDELRPSLIIVDEPELGLHPYAITLLASLIKQAAVGAQVVVSTQSANLLDHFQPEDVLVADRVDGGTQLTRLDGDKLDTWLQDYSLGELWEMNEFGGRPRPERSI